MAKGVFRKQLSHLHPTDDAAEALMRTIKLGEHVMVEVKRPRNLGHHRKFYALMQMVYENQDHFRSVDELVFAVKIRLGHFDSIHLKGGEVYCMPRSLAFHNMDQAEFNAFYERVLDFVEENFGWVREEFEREIVA